MAKNYKKWEAWLMWVLGILMSLYIGGSFANGNAMSLPVLKLITFLVIHQIIGWTIIIVTIGGAAYHLFVK